MSRARSGPAPESGVAGPGVFPGRLAPPWVIPSIVSIASWRWLIADQNGLVNQTLGLFGVGPIFFLSTGDWAMFSVILIKIWRSFPFMMVSCLAALQSIDRDMYEAARIDGAGRWQSFRDITMPQIVGISVVMWILMTIWSVNDFETPWLLTQGGPSNATENLIVLAYKYTFTRNDVGVGSAIAVFSMIFVITLRSCSCETKLRELRIWNKGAMTAPRNQNADSTACNRKAADGRCRRCCWRW